LGCEFVTSLRVIPGLTRDEENQSQLSSRYRKKQFTPANSASIFAAAPGAANMPPTTFSPEPMPNSSPNVLSSTSMIDTDSPALARVVPMPIPLVVE